ncbi:hypothetical protein F5Y10DRAFT_85512 [Nemania abortiva]|nr:hypothetical protein F5Y10DRAFT_85512 [Nemania abortiva]
MPRSSLRATNSRPRSVPSKSVTGTSRLLLHRVPSAFILITGNIAIVCVVDRRLGGVEPGQAARTSRLVCLGPRDINSSSCKLVLLAASGVLLSFVFLVILGVTGIAQGEQMHRVYIKAEGKACMGPRLS